MAGTATTVVSRYQQAQPRKPTIVGFLRIITTNPSGVKMASWKISRGAANTSCPRVRLTRIDS